MRDFDAPRIAEEITDVIRGFSGGTFYPYQVDSIVKARDEYDIGINELVQLRDSIERTVQPTEWNISYMAKEITDAIGVLNNQTSYPYGAWIDTVKITCDGYDTALSRLSRLRDSLEALDEIGEGL